MTNERPTPTNDKTYPDGGTADLAKLQKSGDPDTAFGACDDLTLEDENETRAKVGPEDEKREALDDEKSAAEQVKDAARDALR